MQSGDHQTGKEPESEEGVSIALPSVMKKKAPGTDASEPMIEVFEEVGAEKQKVDKGKGKMVEEK